MGQTRRAKRRISMGNLDKIDDQIAEAVRIWAYNHPHKFSPFIVFLDGERLLSPVEMADAITSRTREGQMQLEVFHSFIEDNGPEGAQTLLGMFSDVEPKQKALRGAPEQ